MRCYFYALVVIGILYVSSEDLMKPFHLLLWLVQDLAISFLKFYSFIRISEPLANEQQTN